MKWATTFLSADGLSKQEEIEFDGNPPYEIIRILQRQLDVVRPEGQIPVMAEAPKYRRYIIRNINTLYQGVVYSEKVE